MAPTQPAQPTIERIAKAFIDGCPRLDADDQRLAQTVYQQLVRRGSATPAAVAEQLGWPVADVETRLTRWPAVFRDDAGAIVGFWGLAGEPVTDHQIDFDGIGRAWTWCSYDMLFITPPIGATAHVTSRCATTGAAVHLTVSVEGVTDLNPDIAVVSMLLPDGPFDDDVRQTLCHFVLFFASPEAAEVWTSQHPGTFALPVADAFEVARRQNAVVFDALVAATERAIR
jgi:alkylmercury lyase